MARLISKWQEDIDNRSRFKFGKNWQKFLGDLSDRQIESAEERLLEWLGDIKGKRFLDIGCGSGIHSLAARKLGARVFSFDFDKDCIEATTSLKKSYFPEDSDWIIQEGSVLSPDYMSSLGKFDIVYSWGVLHHTGQLWEALNNAAIPVGPNGHLYIAIYNHQVYWTRYWTFVKKTYNTSFLMRFFWITIYLFFFLSKGFTKDIVSFKNPLRRYREKRGRGMTFYRDLIDWIGGYPFEAAKPEQIFEFHLKKDYILTKLYTCGGGYGCNEYLFKKSDRL